MPKVNSNSTRSIYLLSIGVFLVGLLGFTIFTFQSYSRLGGKLVELNLPGENIILFEKPGQYSLYRESDSYGTQAGENGRDLDSFLITVKEVMNKRLITLEVPEAVERYSYKGKRGEKIYEFSIPIGGKYKIETKFGSPTKERKISLILDKGFSRMRSENIVKAQAILLFPIVLSLVLFIYGYLKK